MARSSGIKAALQGVVDHLKTNNVRADLDASKVNLPGVWVALASLAPDLLNGDGTLMAYLYLIAPNAAYPDVVAMLDELLGDVLALVDSEDDIVPVSVRMPDSPDSLPSLRVSVLATYTRTETP